MEMLEERNKKEHLSVEEELEEGNGSGSGVCTKAPYMAAMKGKEPDQV